MSAVATSLVCPKQRPSGRLTIGTAARLVPGKGIDLLVDAFGQLAQRRSNVHLEIAGAGPALVALRKQIHALGLHERVRLLGWVTDIRSTLKRWDIFALPTLCDALPIAILEAMAEALPVVASDVGGVPEAVESGRCGILIPPGDCAALYRALDCLAEDPALREQQGANARRKIAESFSLETMGAKLSRIYTSLAAPERHKQWARV